MKILVVSDAWYPQINGVVRTYEGLIPPLKAMNHEISVIGPMDCGLSLPCPNYPEIRLSLGGIFKHHKLIDQARKNCDPKNFHLHIATEGPLGWIARAYANKHNLIFSSCYHTEFPDYVAKRVWKCLHDPVKSLAIKFIREFHSSAGTMFVATESLRHKLSSLNYHTPFTHLTRGVDHNLFNLGEKTEFRNLKKPIALYVGRVAVEKNLEVFLNSKWHGTKVIVGDGPDKEKLSKEFPDAVFVGKQQGEHLAAHFRSADIFVFPSRTDTFGMVLVEAMASGLPVAAYPVTGPVDIITRAELGYLNDNLETAMQYALNAPSDAETRAHHAKQHYSWQTAAEQFIGGIVRYCIH
jgi:glycosyltransferase involved in cell wall biosynthesis